MTSSGASCSPRPEAGTDLASLATTAVRDGDEYVVNGSKIWSSGAHQAHFGILIARTDPDLPKHKGISYFICPMDSPGLTMSPIVDMTTAHSFNQVFFDDVRIPVGLRVGEEGDGWRLAKVTLSNERVVALVGRFAVGCRARRPEQLLDQISGRREASPIPSSAIGGSVLHSRPRCCGSIGLRSLLSATLNGQDTRRRGVDPEDHGRRARPARDGRWPRRLRRHERACSTGSGPVGRGAGRRSAAGATEINFAACGRRSQFPDVDPIWHYGYLFHPALTLGGGTFAVQRNIVAEQVLGLPANRMSNRG